MKTITILCLIGIFFSYAMCSEQQNQFEVDTISTSQGDLLISFIGHGTLMFQINDLVIHTDPVSWYADYEKLPKADIILITHHHGDHLDSKAIELIRKKETRIILTKTCAEKFEDGMVMKNGDEKNIDGINVLAVPAYNLVHKRENGEVFHPKGVGNGYVLSIGDKKVYIAGDTEDFPEMKDINNIDIAFLPMNLPYTMTPQMVVNAVNMLNPKILYPYHFGETDTDEILKLLKDKEDVEVRIRKME